MSTTYQTVQPQGAVAPAAGSYATLCNLYFSPGEAFEQIRRRPRVVVPALGLLVLAALVVCLTMSRVGVKRYASQDFQAAVASGEMTRPEVEAKVGGLVNRIGETTITAVVAGARGLKAVGLALAVAAWLWFAGRFRDAAAPFRQLLSLSLHTQLAVALVYSATYLFLLILTHPDDWTGSNFLFSNPSFLFAGEAAGGGAAFLREAVGWLDLFSLWALALLGFGYARVARRTGVATALAVVALPYAVVALLSSLFAALTV